MPYLKPAPNSLVKKLASRYAKGKKSKKAPMPMRDDEC